MNTVLLLQSLQNEVSSIAQHSVSQQRDYLDDFEVEHLIKMTHDVVMKIKNQLQDGF